MSAGPRVLNARIDGNPEGAVYVGRPSPWGNPYVMRRERDRDEACDRYEQWISTRPELIERAKRELRGRDLVCWCAPKRCHAETLLRIANEPDLPKRENEIT